MSALLIRDLPPEVHRQLRLLAQRNRRSLSAEVSDLLVQALAAQAQEPSDLPVPFAGAFPLTDEWLENSKNEGRAFPA